MKKYYIVDKDAPNHLLEVTEAEWFAIMGTAETHPYVSNVYSGNITIDEVPEELREAVQTAVENRIARWGGYQDSPISSEDFQTMVEEVL